MTITNNSEFVYKERLVLPDNLGLSFNEISISKELEKQVNLAPGQSETLTIYKYKEGIKYFDPNAVQECMQKGVK